MKVLLVTMKMHIGGAETHVLELARGLRKRGVTVHVASAGGVFADQLQKEGISHVTLPLDRRELPAMMKAKKGLKALIKRERYDIVHAHARIPAFLVGMLHKKDRFRFVTTDHLDFEVTPLLKKMTDWGEFTFAVSEDLKGYLMSEYGLSPSRIALTVNGVDTERFSPKAVENRKGAQGRLQILHISRLDAPVSLCAKELMDAAAMLHEKVTLTIVGDGDHMPRLREKAEAINGKYGETIRFVGAVSDVTPYIHGAGLVVAPSRAAMEGMSCAVPTIVAGSQGYGGIFSEEIEAEAYRSNFCFRDAPLPTAERLCLDIETVLHMDADERRALGERGRAYILSHFSVDHMVETQLAVYQKLLPITLGEKPQVLIAGYYGFGNLGDEALLSVILRELRRMRPALRIAVLSGDPKKTARDHLVDGIQRLDLPLVGSKMEKGALLLFGGGSLLQDKTSNRSLSYYLHLLHMAKKKGMRIAVFANGIGPLTRSENERRVREALRLSDHLSLRDGAALRFCEKDQALSHAVLTFDPVILTDEDEKRANREDVFVIIPKKGTLARHEILVKSVKRLGKRTGLSSLVMPFFDRQDGEEARCLAEETGAKLVIPKDYEEARAVLSRARLVISSRLHGLVLATAAGVPMVAFSDDSKLHAYMETVMGEGKCPSTEEALLAATMDALQNEESIRFQLLSHLPAWKGMAKAEFEALSALLPPAEK